VPVRERAATAVRRYDWSTVTSQVLAVYDMVLSTAHARVSEDPRSRTMFARLRAATQAVTGGGPQAAASGDTQSATGGGPQAATSDGTQAAAGDGTQAAAGSGTQAAAGSGAQAVTGGEERSWT
jgi:predicted carbohydrate-binding protein with CBM5 and CBM33 domain